MPFIALKCPSCGADINLDSGHEFIFCPYCKQSINKKTIHDEYIKSPKWQAKRNERLKVDNYRCARCGADEKRELQVHHISYKNLGDEDVYNDLITLCKNCHSIVHTQPSCEIYALNGQMYYFNHRKGLRFSELHLRNNLSEVQNKEYLNAFNKFIAYALSITPCVEFFSETQLQTFLKIKTTQEALSGLNTELITSNICTIFFKCYYYEQICKNKKLGYNELVKSNIVPDNKNVLKLYEDRVYGQKFYDKHAECWLFSKWLHPQKYCSVIPNFELLTLSELPDVIIEKEYQKRQEFHGVAFYAYAVTIGCSTFTFEEPAQGLLYRHDNSSLYITFQNEHELTAAFTNLNSTDIIQVSGRQEWPDKYVSYQVYRCYSDNDIGRTTLLVADEKQ